MPSRKHISRRSATFIPCKLETGIGELRGGLSYFGFFLGGCSSASVVASLVVGSPVVGSAGCDGNDISKSVSVASLVVGSAGCDEAASALAAGSAPLMLPLPLPLPPLLLLLLSAPEAALLLVRRPSYSTVPMRRTIKKMRMCNL
jgi:hypothetical protein